MSPNLTGYKRCYNLKIASHKSNIALIPVSNWVCLIIFKVTQYYFCFWPNKKCRGEHDAVIIISDFNAKVRKDVGFMHTIGSHSHSETNNNGVKLVQLSTANTSVIVNTRWNFISFHEKKVAIMPMKLTNNKANEILKYLKIRK